MPIKRGSRVGVAIDDEDDTKVKYCENCLNLNRTSVLKQRVYLDDKGKALPQPPDAEDWLQCWTCGLIVAAIESKTETKLTGVSGVEPLDSPYDFGETIIEPIGESRNFSKKEGPDYKKMKKELAKVKDPQLRKDLAAGAELISYEES